MSKVIEFDRRIPNIGFLNRKTKEGPEKELLKRFTVHMLNSLKINNSNLAVFYETKLDTGYPDLVLVKYKPEMPERIPSNRPVFLS